MRDIHPEDQRQLDYIAQRTAQPGIDPADHSLMTARRKRIMEKYPGHITPARGIEASQFRG